MDFAGQIAVHKNVFIVIPDPSGYATIRVYKAGYAGVGRPGHGYPVFHRSKHAHCQKLIGSGGFSKPALVGYIQHEVGAIFYKLSKEIRKRIFPAYDGAESDPIEIKQGELFPWIFPVSVLFGNDEIRPLKSAFIRQIFRKRQQTNLEVLAEDFAFRGNEDSGITPLSEYRGILC